MRTRAALYLCLALAPAPALSQTAGVIDLTESSNADQGGRNDQVINLAECSGNGDTLRLDWNVSGTWASSWSVYKLFATTASDCGTLTTNSLASDVSVTSNSTIGTVASVDVRSKIVTPFSVTCTPNGTPPTNIRLCASAYDNTGAAVSATATKTVTFDFALPDKPINVTTTPGDGALRVDWTAATTGQATSSDFAATATPVDAGALTGVTCNSGGSPGGCSASTGSTSCRITGLTNGACYLVQVVAYSAARNPSAGSTPVPGVPVPVDDFWKHYTNDGGREQGGCGGPVGALALLVLLPLLPRLRRRAP